MFLTKKGPNFKERNVSLRAVGPLTKSQNPISWVFYLFSVCTIVRGVHGIPIFYFTESECNTIRNVCLFAPLTIHQPIGGRRLAEGAWINSPSGESIRATNRPHPYLWYKFYVSDHTISCENPRLPNYLTLGTVQISTTVGQIWYGIRYRWVLFAMTHPFSRRRSTRTYKQEGGSVLFLRLENRYWQRNVPANRIVGNFTVDLRPLRENGEYPHFAKLVLDLSKRFVRRTCTQEHPTKMRK